MTCVTPEVIKLVQKGLNKHFGASVDVDGHYGKQTAVALMKVSQIPNDWDPDRKMICLIQLYALLEGIDAGPPDGLCGPQTQFAIDVLSGKEPNVWRDDEGLSLAGTRDIGKWPPQEQNALMNFYGDVGENQVKIQTPYPLRIAWEPKQVINKFSCHEKVADSLVRVMERVLDAYGLEEIQGLRLDLWGGCLNVRPMRGGTKWSTHSWGIAIDWDPDRNQLKWNHTKASLARPEYDTWWKLWEEEGWTSLGRAKDYDWMHVQAANVSK